MAEEVECCGWRRRIRRLKKSKGNHKFCTQPCSIERIVYLLIPTSNHNTFSQSSNAWLVVYLLIPTSNHNPRLPCVLPLPLYIFWFLHQTTTAVAQVVALGRCISFDSYIKPQLSQGQFGQYPVVYLLIPTSNHNKQQERDSKDPLYIFWFLHQTTTYLRPRYWYTCCISFDSYIKPQLSWGGFGGGKVVYLLIPTSNHNPGAPALRLRSVVYLLIPTSNHNL